MKNINYNPQNKLKVGLDKVADAVKITIGPKGKNVGIERGLEPLITNDGGTIAHEIGLKDKVEHIGAQIIKGVISKTSEKVGGGRTAAAILTQAIVTEGLKQVENGMNLQLFKLGMEQAVEDISKELKKNSQEISSKEQIQQIATISTESKKLGEVIADVVDKVGKDCIVTVEESQSLGITSQVVEGIKFDKGYISPFMITNPQRMEAEFKDIPVLVTDKKVTLFKDLFNVVKGLAESGTTNLLLVCEDLEGEALNQSVVMKLKGQFNLLAVKAPGFQDKAEWLEDIAELTGTKVVSDSTGVQFDVALGKAKKVISTKDSTILLGSQKVDKKVANLKSILGETEDNWQKDRIKQRISRLEGAVAVIKVGAATETELKYLKQKIEDGVNESKRALEEGIVIGGNCAFIHAKVKLKVKKGIDEISRGYNLILKAVEAPLRQIILNSNGKPDIIIDQLEKHSNNAGFDANEGVIKPDMFEAGIIDALKVSRTILENSLSGASMFLTIQTTVTNLEEKENNQPKVEY